MIYITSLPYMNATPRKAYLPKEVTLPGVKPMSGHGNLAFIMATTPAEVIHVIDRPKNCMAGTYYKYLYHNLRYRGKIGNRSYNLRDLDGRKNIYDRISNPNIHPHPPTLLSKTPDYNTLFDMSTYIKLYNTMSAKFQPSARVNLYWNYMKSIWNGEQTSQYPSKFVLVDVDLFDNFNSTDFMKNIENPLFIFYYSMSRELPAFTSINMDFYFYSDSMILRVNPSKTSKRDASNFRTQLKKVFKRSTRWEDVTDEKEVSSEVTKASITATLNTRYNMTGRTENTRPVATDLPPAKKVDKPEPVVKASQKIMHPDVVSQEQKKVAVSPVTKTSSAKNSYVATDVEKKEDIEQAKKVIATKIDQKIDQTTKEIKAVTDAAKTPEEAKAAADYVKTKSEMDLDNDKELIESMYKVMQATTVPTKPVSTARDAAMRKRQEEIKLENMTFQDVKNMNAAKRPIPEKDISGALHTINDNMKTVRFANVNKDYIENVIPADLMNAFTCLNNKSMPFYVRDIQTKDTSDELNYKMTMKVTLEDEAHQRHVVTVDIPKFLDDKFLYLGGNKKLINKQNFLYPVVKTAPDTVQIVSNYNKIFVRRIGAKSISSVERLIKLIYANPDAMKLFTVGNAYITNKQYLTTLEYDEFSKVITKFKTPTCTIFFNQEEATKYIADHNIEAPKCDVGSEIFIGFRDKNRELWLNSETQMVGDEPLCDIIAAELPENIREEYFKTRNTKKVMYSTATLMKQSMPLIVYMLYWEGITSVFKKMNLRYEFSKSYPKSVKPSQGVIRFKDCYMLYDADMATALLMNGMKVLDTESHDLNEYNSVEAYVDYFKKVYGKVSIMSAISNYYDFMIDPITEEILRDINLPTDLIDVCIYANSLLVDDSYTFESSQRIARVRSSEVIPAILYYQLSRSYLEYKNSNGKKKLSLPRNAVIKELMALQTVEDYSTLNPVVELEKDRSISAKGYRGVNVERAYTEEKRSYDASMIGVIGMSTSPDGNCGINRTLTMEPNITSARGYVDIKENERDDLKDVNVFSPGELLYPLGATRDDSIRTAMAVKQSKHVIPVKNAAPALIANGSDEAIRFDLSSDFVINAAEDGKVIDYDPKSNILMLEYKSGKHQAVNLAPNIVKNGGGGFYLSNELITKYKVGDKFKKDDAIAWHKDFFKDDGMNGLRMNVGVLEKVAIISSYNTYNDCTVITKKLAGDAEANMTFCKSVVIGKNSNVYDIRKVNNHINIGDPLIAYDTSFEDSDLNKLLASLSDDNKELIDEGSKNVIKSKYAGKIVGIKIYSAVELEDMSPSLRKIVSSYYNGVKEKKGFLDKYADEGSSIVKCGLLVNETTGKIEPNIYGVIKGQKINDDGVLIEFYIEHPDILGVGDKIAYFTALKGIIGEIIPEGYEPYSEFRPDEEVSSLIPPSSILKRQVPSILITVLGNKIMVELKRKLEEIYNS